MIHALLLGLITAGPKSQRLVPARVIANTYSADVYYVYAGNSDPGPVLTRQFDRIVARGEATHIRMKENIGELLTVLSGITITGTIEDPRLSLNTYWEVVLKRYDNVEGRYYFDNFEEAASGGHQYFTDFPMGHWLERRFACAINQ